MPRHVIDVTSSLISDKHAGDQTVQGSATSGKSGNRLQIDPGLTACREPLGGMTHRRSELYGKFPFIGLSVVEMLKTRSSLAWHSKVPATVHGKAG